MPVNIEQCHIIQSWMASAFISRHLSCTLIMKVREILKLLKDDGWYLVITEGSHRQFKHPTKPGRVTAPVIRAMIFTLKH